MRPTPNSVGILGSTGYVGQILNALLMQHPCIRPVTVQGRSPAEAGPRAVAKLAACDALAFALPSEAAREWTAAIKLASGGHMPKLLDLSDAHRLDAPDHESAPTSVHYGLPELYGAPSQDCEMVANPGCYPTATLLSLRPLLEEGLIDPGSISILGASGASGAGKGLAEHLHFCNLSENVFPYHVGEHRHQPEIERHLGHGAQINFVTTLLPIVRGLQVTSFVQPKEGVSAQQIAEALISKYVDHRWVTVLQEPGQGLGLRHVIGSHQAVIAVAPSKQAGQVAVFCSIDNLMRGAASQAVHNLNLWFGLFAGLGLPAPIENPSGVPAATGQIATRLMFA